MKSVLPALVLAVMATSCTTAYKVGQTPDDVYYSPERKVESNEYVQMNRDNASREYRTSRRAEVDDDFGYNEDRYLRMKVRNRNRWSDFDNYYNDPYAAGYFARPGLYAGVGMWGGNFWSPFSYWNAYNNWNYFYNPYHRPLGWGHNVIVVNPVTNPVYNRPRTFNLNTFNRGGTSNDPKRSNNSYQPLDSRPYRGSNAGSAGSELRRSFGTNNSNNSYSTPSRSTSSPSNSGSSSGSSRGSSAPVRRF